jgi:two-component system NarL family sensor kinase
LGVVYYDKKELQNALACWDSSLAVRKQIKDIYGIANVNVKKGAAYFQLGHFEKSLLCQLEALKSYEQLNSETGIAQALNNVAAVYEHQQQLDKALEYYQRSLAVKEKMNDHYQIGIALINIGNIHYRKNEFSQAREFASRAVAELAPYGNRAYDYLATAYNNLAETYTQLSQYDSALANINRAIGMRQSINDYQGIVSSQNNLGRIETKLKKYPHAENVLLQALALAKSRNLLLEENKIHLNLYELYRERKLADKALDQFVSYTETKDSLLNETSHRQVTELQVQYETEKKEQQIALQQLQLNENQARLRFTYTIIALLAGLVISAVVIFLLARSRHRRTRELLLKEKEISVREAFIQASISSQENERKRFAQDLHDGMGQLISSLRLVLNPVNKNTSMEERIVVMNKAENMLDDMHREIRSIAFNLMPQTLIQYGLIPALKEMTERINASGGIAIRVVSFDLPERLEELQEVSLYRIVQEWINNIIKYAAATVIEVQLVSHEDEIMLTIEDNGKGFDPGILEMTAGNGWKNIRSRNNLLKGDINVDSSPGKNGTTLSLSIPNSLKKVSSAVASLEV